jgi:hypothetical protein
MCTKNPGITAESLSLSVFLSLITIRFIIHGLFLTVSASAFVTLQFQISRDHFRSDAVRQVGSAIIGQLDPSAGSAKETQRACVCYNVCGRVRLEGIEPLLLHYLKLEINVYRFLQGTITTL